MKKRVFLFILVLFVCLAGVLIYRLFRYSAMPGIYTAKVGYKGHIDTYFLELREDGTFTQEIIDYKGKKYTNSGEWKFDWVNGDPSIRALNFMSMDPFTGNPEYSSWICSVKTSLLGRRQLWFGESCIFSYRSPPIKPDKTSKTR